MLPPRLALSGLVSVLLGAALACDGASSTAPPAPPAIATPTAPVMPAALPEGCALDRVIDGAAPSAVALRGDRAYVADGNGISVMRVDAGGHLDRACSLPTRGLARDLAVAGETLFVAEGRAGLGRYALDAPDCPRPVDHIALPRAALRVIASAQGVAAIAEGGVIAILRPGEATPEILALPGDPRDATWVDRSLYVADTGDGLLRISIDPAPARVTHRDRGLRWALSLGSRGALILVGSKDKRVALLDASGPSPREIASVRVDHRPARIFAMDDRMLVADTDPHGGGATLISAAEAPALTILARRAAPVLGAARVGPSLAIEARGGGGIAIASLDPSGAEAAHLPGLVIDRVAAMDDRVIAWSEEGARAFSWTEATGVRDLAAEEIARLQQAEIAPGPPTVTREHLERLTVEGARGVAIDPVLGLLQVFDMTPAPRRRGSFLLQSRPSAVALAGGVALVAERSAGLQIVDVADPDRPREISWLPMDPGPHGVAVIPASSAHPRARVALALGEDGLAQWSWDGRAALAPEARSNTPGVASDVAFARGSIWIADRTGLLRCRVTEADR